MEARCCGELEAVLPKSGGIASAVLPTSEAGENQARRQTIQQLVSDLAKTLSRHTVLNVLGTLGSILRVARSWGYIVGEIRRDALVLPAEKLARPVPYFSAEQVVKIIEAAHEEPYRTMFIVAALTGLQAGEVCGLFVDDLANLVVKERMWNFLDRHGLYQKFLAEDRAGKR
jgi:hypothetical protein